VELILAESKIEMWPPGLPQRVVLLNDIVQQLVDRQLGSVPILAAVGDAGGGCLCLLHG
jgi:hypothetical protein